MIFMNCRRSTPSMLEPPRGNSLPRASLKPGVSASSSRLRQ